VWHPDQRKEPYSAWELLDGSNSTDTNWNSGQPDDYEGEEDCSHIYTDIGTWNDMDCDRTERYGTDLYYICEASID